VASAVHSSEARAIRSAVSIVVPDGASRLLSWWSSMISAESNQGSGDLGEAHHQHGADGEVGGDDGVDPFAVEEGEELRQVAVVKPGAADEEWIRLTRTSAGFGGRRQCG
jgi:hypothetical protein